MIAIQVWNHRNQGKKYLRTNKKVECHETALNINVYGFLEMCSSKTNFSTAVRLIKAR